MKKAELKQKAKERKRERKKVILVPLGKLTTEEKE